MSSVGLKMAYRKVQLVNDEIYHVVVRGAGDMEIFKDEHDYYRGIFSLYEFNNSSGVTIRDRRATRLKNKKIDRRMSSGDRNMLVEVMAFCFMPNHIHLLLRQINDEGITKFMRKFGTGYSHYFNKKHNKMGHLFQGRFKPVIIEDDRQLEVVFTYIHTNPVSLIEPKWKEKGIKDAERAYEFLENFKWHSFPDYLGKQNFPSVIQRDFLFEQMGEIDGCRKAVKNSLQKNVFCNFGVDKM
jgi:putative transposase